MAFIVELAAPAVAAGGSGTRCAATIDGRDDVFGVVSAARPRPFEMCSVPTEDSKTKRSRLTRPPPGVARFGTKPVASAQFFARRSRRGGQGTP